ncbi:MAG: DNA topoisomerase VI subunit B [Planctomycetota bacterium]|nr:MAG: DNA topoisomerase VI subunit B [Planctomycetota bacterium]
MPDARKRSAGPAPRQKKKKNSPAPAAARSAEALAKGQREIPVSEFFAKNRHLLGFDNPRKALLTTIKEAVDNALDACEEAGILPDIAVRIDHLPEVDENRFRVTVEDNGPGVVRKQIDNIFGALLYGSKFHRLRMSRGQQGIGISAAGMYGLLTTGRPMIIVTRSKKGRPAHHVELAIDTTKNRPEVSVDEETDDFPPHTGTRVIIELEGRYSKGRTSVDEYLEQTAIANPHARIVYTPPARNGDTNQAALNADDADTTTVTPAGEIVFPRTVRTLPPEPREIKPHPRGVELGALMRMLKQTGEKNLGPFLQREFCRVGPGKAKEICAKAGLTTRTWVKQVDHAGAEALYKAIQGVSLIAPPTDCLAPIGARQILAGLLKGVRAEFYTASTRPPAVYRGNPFQVEVGLAFGGDLPGDGPARVIRFANRVPLLYQQSACSAYKAVVETSWKNYGLAQGRGAAPEGPLVVMVHMASVWVPFTSESKEAIADYDEIRKEMRLALQECGRKLGVYLRKRQRAKRERERRGVYERYIGEIARAVHTIDPSIDADRVRDGLLATAERLTALADVEFDDDGNPVGPARDPRDDDDGDTIVVDRDGPPTGGAPGDAGRGARPPDTQPPPEPRGARRSKARKTATKKKRSRRARASDSLFSSESARS